MLRESEVVGMGVEAGFDGCMLLKQRMAAGLVCACERLFTESKSEKRVAFEGLTFICG